MRRRDVLKGMGMVSIYGNFPSVLAEFLSSTAAIMDLRAGFFTDEEFDLVTQIADALLPKTSTPGAVEAGVPYFLDLVIKNCMDSRDQQLIREGLHHLNARYDGKFSSLSPEEKIRAIQQTDEASFREGHDEAWFRIFKKLATIGFFTSQEGMTRALNYVKVPGAYKACIPYSKGERGLAKTFLLYW
jgi:hypothetical protein